MQLTDKLNTLRNIMLRRDLSAAELRICWYLLTQAMNATGNCCCSNQHLANALNLKLSSIHRAKENLRSKKILTWPKLGKLAASAHLASTYNFTNLRGDASTQLAPTAPTQSALAAPTQSALAAPTQPEQKRNIRHAANTSRDAINQHLAAVTSGDRFYAKFDSPEWNYWDAFLRKTTGKGACRDKRGGWHFPTQWPQEDKTNDRNTYARSKI